ncbi:hypothetical protein Tco_0548138 [Tanacetum coccineum]
MCVLAHIRGTSEQDGREGERSGDRARSGRGGQGSGRGSQEGGKGGQGSGRGSQGGGRDGQESDQGSQGSSQDNGANGGGGGVPDFATVIAEQLQNLLPTIGNVRTMNNGRVGCSYKEFMACNLKDYEGKGGAIVYTRWIEKMESVQDMSRCEENQKVKYNAGSFISKALTWWNSQVRTRGREAAVGMTWEDFKTLTRCNIRQFSEF